jgi:ATP-dependent Clp protease ATP-binding subunit ClpC
MCRIDEIHMLVGAGAGSKGGGSGLDISNLLKPPLARGELQCIGATTLDEHRKYIEKDAALERRFQPVQVAEPTQAETLEILHGLQVDSSGLVNSLNCHLQAGVAVSIPP